ncbi:Peptidyl-prolyl isomerase cwc27 [Tieghemiomyces parasiticus]|uniref:Peptidyl-prolyl isomerase CWC27 n=1 Tax=Tieghemiomyces parasiticus TaxID=78921 RepID=A0A9W7ZU77_9FUNG|nr:Peptidyl-prolyl isomerase cwc27 [Tieghemiomyces parasiticus]
MSTIYNQEPATRGQVTLKTTVGDIELTFWTKEAPKACRNFVQLCLEGYYDETIFHRVVSGFIVQGGDPTGTGEGGESIYGEPFNDELHSRLRFTRRGLLAMANAGKNDNGSQFFITLDRAEELQNKHTIFGTVVGDTIFTVLKIGSMETNDDEKPLVPPRITEAVVEDNPFPDIVPRITADERRHMRQRQTEEESDPRRRRKRQGKAVKNRNLLSFGAGGEEGINTAEDKGAGAEEEGGEIGPFSGGTGKQASTFKMRSMHDLVVDDARLSKTAKAERRGTDVPTKSVKQAAPPAADNAETPPSTKTDTDSTARVVETKDETAGLLSQESEVPKKALSSKRSTAKSLLDGYTKRKALLKKDTKGSHEDQLLNRLASFRQKLQPGGKGIKRDRPDPEAADNPEWLRHRLVFDKPDTGRKATPGEGGDHIDDYVVLDAKRRPGLD